MIDFYELGLIARMRAGRPEAFAELYDRYARRLKGYALRLSGDNSDAEDLVQETLLAAWQGRETFRGRVKLLSWLLGIASRRWRDRCRQRSVSTISLTLQEGEFEIPSQEAPHKSLEKEVILQLTLEAALATLELPFRDALLLVHSQGMTYKEAAEILAEPIGTVKWRVSAALKKIKQKLTDSEEEFDELQQAATRAIV